jgi:hypothetical protein
MKASYHDLMTKLGVGRPLHPYETQPWMTTDNGKGITCEGEVRCNHDKSEIEAELQFIYDTPPEGKPPVEQICVIRCEKRPSQKDEYAVVSTIIRGEEWKGRFHDWETKSCNFFRACIREVKADKIPDIDDILKKEMKEDGRYGGKQGDGSNKAPKINAGQLLYDRKGIGAGF